MYTFILVCEGKNDIIFLHDTIITKLNIDNNQIRTYNESMWLQRDITSGRAQNISILKGEGFPNCIYITVRLARQLWYLNISFSIGIITNEKPIPVYNKLRSYLEEYINTPCKKHNINPQISYSDSEQKLNITLNRRSQTVMWTLEIPETLETQICKLIKRNYPELWHDDDEHQTIKNVCDKFKVSEDELIKKVLCLFDSETWYARLCDKLRSRIMVGDP